MTSCKQPARLALAVLLLSLAGCGGGSSSAPQDDGQGNPNETTFASFVRERFEDAAEDDPTSLTNVVFTDLPIVDPAAFDDLLDDGNPLRGDR